MSIDDEQHAARLAHAILSDIRLYNAEKIRAATRLRRALANEILEGRALYATRVTERFVGVFDRELTTWIRSERPDLPDDPNEVFAPMSAEPPLARECVSSEPTTRGGPRAVFVTVAAVSLASVATWWFMHH